MASRPFKHTIMDASVLPKQHHNADRPCSPAKSTAETKTSAHGGGSALLCRIRAFSSLLRSSPCGEAHCTVTGSRSKEGLVRRDRHAAHTHTMDRPPACCTPQPRMLVAYISWHREQHTLRITCSQAYIDSLLSMDRVIIAHHARC